MNIRIATSEDLSAIAAVHVDSWRSTYAGLVPDDYLQQLNTAYSEQRYIRILANPERQAFFYVAEDESGCIHGYALGGKLRQGPSKYQGELYAIYLLQSAQRQGLGRRLFETVLAHFQTQGIDSMLVWVLAENDPTRHFYEAMGGVKILEQEIEIGRKRLAEVAYGWSDLLQVSTNSCL